MIYGIAK